MHIKHILISGFRSFRSQTEIDQFSPKHNVIVGRNGSGKSNYFDAIQFVLLGPKFANLRQEDRHHLLHEGTGQGVMAAYVEIIFDNSDGRLSVESEEVVLRRTIGHKKDEFFVNRKRVQKQEIQALLESAGFSKSNPYYIVQQGKVANLCVMKDTDRLTLLKDIAGTTVYEERREESLRIMKDCDSKQVRIDELLDFIDERMTELEKEKEELSEYDTLDKQRRALEYTLFDKEMTKASSQVQAIENTREEEREKQQEVYAELRDLQDDIQELEDSLTSCNEAYERLESKKSEKMKETVIAFSNKNDIEVALQETQALSKSKFDEIDTMKKDLQDILASIKTSEQQLGEVEPEHKSLIDRKTSMTSNLASLREQIDQLYGKQGRSRQFNSKKERDAFLNTQISAYQSQYDSGLNLIAKEREACDRLANDIRKERNALAGEEKSKQENTASFNEMSASIREAIVQRNELQEQRKFTWRDIEDCEEELSEIKQDLEHATRQLNTSLPKQVVKGLQAVENIVREKNIEGYYGTLIDNFTLKAEGFRTAVEVAVGSSLFHCIVDTDATAAILIKELENRKIGRLTFIPLNRIYVPDVQYPDSNDVRPLLDTCLEYPEHLELAFKHVFGKKLLARDLDVAAHFSKEYKLDAITKDGDLVNRRGGFEGGFHDDRLNKIRAVGIIRECNQRISALYTKKETLTANQDALETQMNTMLRNLQKLEADRTHLKQTMERRVQEITPRINALSLVVNNQEMRSRSVLSLEKEMAGIKSKIDSFTAEKKQPMKDHLDPEERDFLLSLNTKERELQQELETTEQEVIAMTVRTEALKHDLADNLTKRKVELEQKLSEAQIGLTDVESTDFANLSLEKENAVLMSKNLQTIIDDIEAQVLTKRSEKERLTTQIEAKRAEEAVIVRNVEEATKMHDKLMNKRTMLMDTIRNKSRAIRDLGTLPRAEAEVVKNYSEKQLMEKLSEVQESLKKFPGVNRKALDQYVLFNEQRETLNERKGELDEESKSIQKLVDNLDIQKEEAILRTFKGVSHHFSQVFSELVATGKGQLIMRTSDDEDAEGEDLAKRYEEDEDEGDSDEDEEGGTKKRSSKGKNSSKSKTLTKSKSNMPSISTFRGVQVRVSFSGDGQTFEMKQLSGGQKALVALALIFAIQRCDPAPFYLFDEIDQALDASYRAQVARLIHKQAHDPNNPAQFITTTFRPEMVDVADKHYGIALVSKASNIYPLNKSDATNFVTNMMLQEESVGEVTRVATYTGDPRQRSAIMDASADESRAFDETVLGGEQGFDESKMSSPVKKGKKGDQEEETEDVTKFEIEEVRRPLPATTAKADEQSDDEDEDDEDENLFAAKNRKKGARGSKRKGSVKA